jgi:hypothetical protein
MKAPQGKILLLIIALSLAMNACAVKSDLTRPDGKTTPRDEPDPSKPPYPVGR